MPTASASASASNVLNDNDCIMGGTQTLEQAEAMKKRFEIEDARNPWTKGTTQFYIQPA